jgi:putative transposase
MLSVARQCELLGLSRSSYYYKPAEVSTDNLKLMRLVDEQYMRTPFYGSRRMRAWLRTEGYTVSRKRIQRLMRTMGLEAIYPRPKTTVVANEHKIYPYLLRGVKIVRPNQVWSTDITYIPMRSGFLYLVAILDWYSRYVLSWTISNSLERSFCLEALDRALERSKPEIFNTDQGCQFTSVEFTGRLLAAGIKVSMDGRGRALDNVFVERLWRSVKYEEVYIKDYSSARIAIRSLGQYFRFYNEERLHQSLEYQTPETVHFTEA